MGREHKKDINELRLKALKNAIVELPPKMSMAFELFEIQGKTIQEIANEMHISINEARSYLSDSARFLKDYFSKHPELNIIVE